ncbi:hypothetical protein EhV049 [Emiliania huxleyi virus 86]|uniref:Uncharacterized protein n=1 Tax=Emiliania huxleyi virus 86 (isolate United Kingdom/English Channel/1999) TaxID=654925 RepID=Q4A384_EHV8U|nr:hypothetical protein EhV049 [Emiliania huxleyi virus 86]AHA55650.1 hypothetical protein EhV164_00060 [Emiliania huxleyi virus 164]CAI65472.1 hypothetical protein EhV049 [Emiliania huxleyi virus 86]
MEQHKNTLDWLHNNEAEIVQNDVIDDHIESNTRRYDIMLATYSTFSMLYVPARMTYANNRFYINKKEYIVKKIKPKYYEIVLMPLNNSRFCVHARFLNKRIFRMHAFYDRYSIINLTKTFSVPLIPRS